MCARSAATTATPTPARRCRSSQPVSAAETANRRCNSATIGRTTDRFSFSERTSPSRMSNSSQPIHKLLRQPPKMASTVVAEARDSFQVPWLTNVTVWVVGAIAGPAAVTVALAAPGPSGVMGPTVKFSGT